MLYHRQMGRSKNAFFRSAHPPVLCKHPGLVGRAVQQIVLAPSIQVPGGTAAVVFLWEVLSPSGTDWGSKGVPFLPPQASYVKGPSCATFVQPNPHPFQLHVHRICSFWPQGWSSGADHPWGKQSQNLPCQFPVPSGTPHVCGIQILCWEQTFKGLDRTWGSSLKG